MNKHEEQKLPTLEAQISDELSNDELDLVSGGCRDRRSDSEFEKGKRDGDAAERKIKNGVKRGIGFVVGLLD